MLIKKSVFTNKNNPHFLFALLICFLFFIAYSILSIVRHNSYGSFGFDLGINNQIVWEYSKFKTPITTIDHVPFISKLNVHVEIVYALISPFYWIWSDARMLLILEVGFVCFSGMAIYLLAKRYKLHTWVQFALLINYLMFYGAQNALWFDVHSATFATAFTAWFLYFLVSKNNLWSMVFFILAIISKENLAAKTFLISIIYFIATKKKASFYFAFFSLVYLAFIFGIYFPYLVEGGFRFQNTQGLFSTLNPMLMIDTTEKWNVYVYTFLSYGFLPFLTPLYLIPVIDNFASYFILGSSVTTAQGLFLHYRIGLVVLMSWATIETLAKFRWPDRKSVAIYLIACTFIVQYALHLPLSYLTKSWFWTEPSGVKNINNVIEFLPKDASVVSQNNITPHISQRDLIFTLWPEKKEFSKNSPCGQKTCQWFRWADSPDYLIVDTSKEWDIRHLLADREDYIEGLTNLERAGVVKKFKQSGNTVIYKIIQNPRNY